MKTHTVKDFKINVCKDILEWGIEMYGIPKESKPEDIGNKEDLESECMGFAEPTGNEIWIFIPKEYEKTDLALTIAHEVGHCMKSPGRSPEKKAEHYENFYLLVNEIIESIQ